MSDPPQYARDIPTLQGHAAACDAAGLWVRCFMDNDHAPDGWKLHVSFGPRDYARVVEAVAQALVPRHVPFKVIQSDRDLERLNDGAFGLLQVGKAITVYPSSEAAAAAIADALSHALGPTPGPPVTTDCPFRDGGPVWFRYGPNAFRFAVDPLGQAGRTRVNGAPDSHDPESWPPRRHLPESRPLDHLVGLRAHYDFLHVLHLSAKGGVFLARAHGAPEGARLVVKTARRGAHLDGHGRDAVWALAREHALLTRLRGQHGLPMPGEFYEDPVTAALIRPYLPGITWRELWEQPDARTLTGRMRLSEILVLLRTIVTGLHEAGLAVRDLSPDNILVTPDGPILLDLELAHSLDSDSPPYRRGTLGFYPHDTSVTPREQDEYALGALRFMSRLDAYPAWFHDGYPAGEERLNNPPTTPPVLDVDHLRASLARTLTETTPDHANVYTGLAGFVLCAHEGEQGDLLASPGLQEKMGDCPGGADDLAHISGLYFGAPGILLARVIHAHAMELPEQRDAAVRVLEHWTHQQPDIPDIAHGRAGLAWACLAAGRALDHEALTGRGLTEARSIAESATWNNDACCWPWPMEKAYGTLSGVALPGFAHGVAGILYVLCRAHAVSADPSIARAVRGGVQFLHALARPVDTDHGDGCWWAYDATDRKVWNGWNHGTPGVVKALAAVRRTLPEACEDSLFVRALRGMGAANNGGYSLSQGVASRLDAYAEALPLLDAETLATFQPQADRDFATLCAVQPFALEASAGDPPPEGTGQGLMLGAPGVWLTLLRYAAREVRGHREILP